MLASRPPIVQSHYRQGDMPLLQMQGQSNCKGKDLAFKDLHFSLYRFGGEICGGEGGEIGNIKTKNGQYLFPVARKTNWKFQLPFRKPTPAKRGFTALNQEGKGWLQCQIVRGVKLSTVPNCPGAELSWCRIDKNISFLSLN